MSFTIIDHKGVTYKAVRRPASEFNETLLGSVRGKKKKKAQKKKKPKRAGRSGHGPKRTKKLGKKKKAKKAGRAKPRSKKRSFPQLY